MLHASRAIPRPTKRPSLSASPWIAAFMAIAASGPPAPAQTAEVGSLVATDFAPGDDFGIMVAADGDVLVARSRAAAYVYRRVGGAYQFEQQIPSPEIQDNPGLHDSIAVEGDLLALGFPQGDGPIVLKAPKGTVHLFRFDGAQWGFEAELISSGDALGTNFGDAVDIDGDTLVIGAPTTIKTVDLGGGQQSAFAQGNAFVFERQGGTWVELQTIPPPDDPQVNMRYGNAVAIDGDYLAIGAFFDKPVDIQIGSVYVFRRVAGTWTFLEKLLAPDAVIGAQFGRCVSIDDDRLVVGAPRADGAATGSGKAYLYDLSPAGAQLRQQLAPTQAAFGDSFGIDVDLQGNQLVVGACYVDSQLVDTGALFRYDFVNGVWLQRPRIESSQSSQAELLGWNVSVTAGGVAAGMLRDYGGQVGFPGQVRLFEPDGGLACAPVTYGLVEGVQYPLSLTPSPAVIGQNWTSFLGPAGPVPLAFLVIGPQPAFLPVEGSAVLVDPGTFTLVSLGQVLGSYFINLPIPAGAPELVGKTVFAQGGTVESLATGGLRLSAGLMLTLCP
jgi:hypothetical protein